MTNDKMNELDKWLAEHVMGWSYDSLGGLFDAPIHPAYILEDNSFIHIDDWQPTRNIAQAWQTLEKVTEPPRTLDDAKRALNSKIAYWFNHANLWACTANEVALEICINIKKAWEAT